jgi:hypothetical protein
MRTDAVVATCVLIDIVTKVKHEVEVVANEVLVSGEIALFVVLA